MGDLVCMQAWRKQQKAHEGRNARRLHLFLQIRWLFVVAFG
jgi:hypothetical protein